MNPPASKQISVIRDIVCRCSSSPATTSCDDNVEIPNGKPKEKNVNVTATACWPMENIPNTFNASMIANILFRNKPLITLTIVAMALKTIFLPTNCPFGHRFCGALHPEEQSLFEQLLLVV